jgi:hypothetical protein
MPIAKIEVCRPRPPGQVAPLIEAVSMTMNVVLYLLLLCGGILFLVGGLFVTRLTWRADVAPFGRRSRLFQIALHPENFARADRLFAIRVLNLVGGLLLLGALVVVAHDVYSSIAGR